MAIQNAVSTETLAAAGSQGITGMLNALIAAQESGANPGHTHTLANGASDVTASLADVNATTNFEQTLSSTTTVLTVADGAIDFNIASHDTTNGLKLGGTLVSATAAELNIMDGVTSSTADLNATTNFEQTLSSSTTVITVTDGTIDFDIASHDATNGLKLGGTLVTSSAAELNFLAGITPGTGTASKALVLDSGTDLSFTGNLTTTNSITTTSTVESLSAKAANTAILISNGTKTTASTYTPEAAATATLDVSNSNIQSITMPAGNITIAISNEAAGQIFLVEITQDGIGSRTVTWFSTIKWAGGSAPTLTTAANKRDTIGFRVTGTDTYDGFIVGQNI